MEKRVIGVVFVSLMLVLVSSLVIAQTSSSSMKRVFVVSESAVSDEAVFLSPEEVEAMDGADIYDILIFVVGVIAIVVVLYLIIKKWVGKKSKVGKTRRKKKSKK